MTGLPLFRYLEAVFQFKAHCSLIHGESIRNILRRIPTALEW